MHKEIQRAIMQGVNAIRSLTQILGKTKDSYMAYTSHLCE